LSAAFSFDRRNNLRKYSAERSSEGSGLGLAIAKSLMELQNGTLQITVDGDLFKVVLTLRKSIE
jgi:signal transduction histidine kinase